MFESIKNYFRDIRINLSFPQYESKCRDEHKQLAKKRFSTEQLDDEKNKLLVIIESEANAKYDSSIREKEEEKQCHQVIAHDTESLLSFFVRFYKQELDDLYIKKDDLTSKKTRLYEKKNEIRDFLSEAFEEKDKAYSELNYYKDNIDSWYAKSDRTPWLFGNSRKKLPKHSLFGQSFGDLDSDKSNRDSAYDDVKEAKNQIGNLKHEQHELSVNMGKIKNEIGEIFNQINQVKKDRSKMYEFKKAGHNKRDLQNKLNSKLAKITQLTSEISEIETTKKEFITMERHRRGVIDLKSKISEIMQKRNQFLNNFNLEENQQERKRQHREAWLRQRGMT